MLNFQSTRWLLYTEQAPSAWLNFALCGLVGIITAYAFVWISKYYTDYKHKPVRLLALSSSTGHGTNIIAGVSLGMESTALPVLVISVAIISAYWLGQTSGLVDESGNPTGGLFGTAVATMGMLSTAGYVLTMDMFGPIADNAGGIVEMSQQVLHSYVSCVVQMHFIGSKQSVLFNSCTTEIWKHFTVQIKEIIIESIHVLFYTLGVATPN